MRIREKGKGKREKEQVKRKRNTNFLFFPLTCCFSLFLFTFSFSTYALSDKIYPQLETFSRIIELLDKQYVEPLDEQKLIEGAINGMLLSLDPYTVYMVPEMYREFKSDTSGTFGGIGIEITQKDGILTVVSPLEDSPAHSAGIRSGDRIVKINGKSTKGMNMIDAVRQMRGPKGKKVVLTIWREGFDETKNLTIVRTIIKMQSVKYEKLDGGYAYVRITGFQEKTSEDLRKTLDKITGEAGGKLKGIVLDLRDNPGGLLSEAIRVSDLFIDKGPLVSTRGRNHQQEVKEAETPSPYEKLPIVVLINHGSASASEIVAGALQDTRRAKILGTTSFGKGSVQTVVEMDNKSALKVTIARYFTPKGRSIDGKGVVPDIVMGTDELKKAFPKKSDKEKIPDLSDYQKQKAVEYLRKL